MLKKIDITWRFIAAWIWSLIAGTLAFLMMLISPRWGWLCMAKPWAVGVLKIIGVQLDVVGREHLNQAAVYVSNHESLMDVVFLPYLLPRQVKFVAKKELSKIPFWGWALARGGGLMINRQDPRGAVAAISEGVSKLPAGWSVAVYPEGTRSRDGTLGKFKKGAFYIALQAHLPVIPIGLAGSREIIPKHAWFARSGTVHVTVGQPISTKSWTQETIDEHVSLCRNQVETCRAESRHRQLSRKPGAI